MSDEKNNKTHKILKLSILLFLLIGLFFIKEENRDKTVSIIDSFNNAERDIELVNSINVGEALDFELYGENIFVWRGDKLSIYDIDGNLSLEKQFNFEEPLIHFGDNYIYVIDKSTSDIYKLDGSGETLERNTFDKELFNIKEEGKNTVYHAKTVEFETVYIYDKDNVLIGDHSFRDKSIINYEVANSKKYALALLTLGQNKLLSTLEIYGENNQKLHSLDIDREIILYSKFIGKDDLIVLTDTSIYSIKDDKIMWEKSFKSIKDIYIEDQIFLLYSNYLEIIDFDGRTVEKVSFTKDFKKIIPFKNDILIYGNEDFSLISNGDQIVQADLDIDVLNTAKDNIIILKGDKLDIYKLVKR